jgi:3-keto-5-aminohexanoate cleavage enzyme
MPRDRQNIGGVMEKTIITAAVNGAFTSKAQNPGVPYSPQEIARAAIDCAEAGASVVHMHVRDPLTGERAHKPEYFSEAIRLIRNECDIIINTTTGVGPDWPLQDRIAIIPALAADPSVKPEMASLNCGSINFGALDRKKRQFVLNDVQMNPWDIVLHYADTMKQWGVKPELEIYDAGMINNAIVLQSIDALKPPLHFQFVLGVLGGMQPTVDNIVFLKNSIPRDATWSLCVVGIGIYATAPVAIAAGGHVRVGLEDCTQISKGVLAESSAQIVAKIVRMSEEMGREVATPAEARRILSL